MTGFRTICLGSLVLLLWGCSSEDHQNIVSSEACISGFRWNPLDVTPQSTDEGLTDDDLVDAGADIHMGAGEMYPGRSCIGCHTEHGGPAYIVAGTVFREVDERSDCTGIGGVTIEITDANGTVYEMLSNSVGNFYLPESDTDDFTFPYRAKASLGTKSFEMEDAQETGDCASCHTASGEEEAEGRIIVN